MSNELSNLQNTISGAVTGFLSGIMTAPLDVLKIRMQVRGIIFTLSFYINI